MWGLFNVDVAVNDLENTPTRDRPWLFSPTCGSSCTHSRRPVT
jgi:hypothetical protein